MTKTERPLPTGTSAGEGGMRFGRLAQAIMRTTGRVELMALVLSGSLAGCAQVPGVEKFLFATNADRDDAVTADDADVAGVDGDTSADDVDATADGQDAAAEVDTQLDTQNDADGAVGMDTTNCGTVGICDDGDACTNDTCSETLGCAHTAIVCDDGEPCTMDTCDVATGCTHANGSTCGDGACTDKCGETKVSCPADCSVCGDAVCSPGESPKNCAVDCCGACGDGKCIGGACDENATTCAKDCGTACGNKVCDNGEDPGNCPIDCKTQVCGNGVCEAGDGGPTGCPQDCGTACGNCVCEAGETFTNCPNDCGSCGDGTCSVCSGLAETATSCPVDCTTTADPCAALAAFCDDGLPCTDDSCQTGKGCVHLANTAPCEDGNACTTDDTCANGTCGAGQAKGCDDKNGCTADVCDVSTGCVHKNANGIACDDGSLCTLGDICGNGVCVGGKAKDCADTNPCLDDSCIAATGMCMHLPNSATCTDANACTSGEHCSGGTCTGGQAVPCDDGKACTSDYCNAATGCVQTPLSNTPCDDEDVCTSADTCQTGTCAGKQIGCADKDPCTVDSCNSVTGCVHTWDNKATCDDGNTCTSDDACATGKCAGLLRLWQSDVTTDQEVLAIAARPDGGFVTVSRNNKVLAVRAWTQGGVNEWTKTINASPTRAGVAVAANGDVAVAAASGVDGTVHVYTASGAVIAATTVPSGTNGELDSILADAAGGYHAYGRILTSSDPLGDAWFVDLDALGNVTFQVSAGGPSLDALYTAAVATDGGYLLGGLASKSSGGGPFLIKSVPGKSSPQTGITWDYNYPGAGTGQFNQVVATSDGGALAIGEVDVTGNGVLQVLTVRLDGNGKQLWSHVDNAKLGGAGTGAAWLTGDRWLIATAASGLMTRAALDVDGTVLWTTSNTTGGATRMAALPDGTIAVASVSGGAMHVQRTDSFGHADCTTAGACLDKTLVECTDANVCTSDECLAGACAHPGQFDGTSCADGDPCHGASACKQGTCGVGGEVLGSLTDSQYGEGFKIASLPDGSWVVATTTTGVFASAFVAYSAAGAKKWSATYTGFNPQALFVDSSGNTLALGSDPTMMSGSVRRLGPDGVENGNWTLKKSNMMPLTFGGGVEASQGGYIVAASDGSQGYLMQLGSDGQDQGSHNIAGWSQVRGVAAAPDGNVYVSGALSSGGVWMPFVGKYTPWGDKMWRYDYPSTGPAATVAFTAPALQPDGGCAVATASDTLRILRFTADGALRQTDALATGAPPATSIPVAIAGASDGSVIATTTQGTSALVWRVDPHGNLTGSLPLTVTAMPSNPVSVAVSAADKIGLTSGANGGAPTALGLWRLDPFLNDSCKASGACVAKSPVECYQDNSCVLDSCLSSACLHNTRPDGSSCTDGTACTYGDACKASTCFSGAPVLGSWTGSAETGVAVLPWGDSVATVGQTNVGVYVVVSKRDPTGALLWTQKSAAAHVVYNSRPAIDASGNLLVVGHDNATDAAWIWQLDPSGTPVAGTGYTFGANAASEFRAILANNIGGYYAVGTTGKTGTSTPDFWVVQLNYALGQTGSDWLFGMQDGGGKNSNDLATSAALASDGSLYIIGNSTPTSGFPSVLHLLNVNPTSGTTNWQFTNSIPGNGLSYGYDVVATSDNGCFAVGAMKGSSAQSLWVARFNSNGVQQWNRNIQDTTGNFKDFIGYGAAALADGTFAAAGQTVGSHVWRFASYGDALGDWALTGTTVSRMAVASTGGLLFAGHGGSPSTDTLFHTDIFGNESCAGSGTCFDYTTQSCDDKNPCTLDLCAGTCAHTNVVDGLWCEDGDACTVDETCKAGVCGNGSPALWTANDASGASAIVSGGSSNGSVVTAAWSYGKFAVRSWTQSGTSAGSVSPTGAYAGSGRMQVNSDGSYVIAGATDSMTDTNGWLAKYTGSHQKVWTVAPGQIGPPDKLDAVIARSGGGYWGIGMNLDVSAYDQCWIQAFADTDGSAGENHSVGIPGSQVGCVNAHTAFDGSFFVVGSQQMAGHSNGFIAKLGADGSQKWTATFSDVSDAHFYDVAPTFDGGAVAVGGTGKSDVLLVRFDMMGVKSWVRKLSYGDFDEGRGIYMRNDGSFDVAGTCNSQFCLMHLSASGNKQWLQTYGAGRALQILPLNYNGAVLIGESTTNQIVRIDWSGNDTCSASGSCIGMDQTSCSSSMDCSTAQCAAGKCNYSALSDGTACDDGNSCTGGDFCQSGKCSSGTAGSCGDGICSCSDTMATCPADCSGGPALCGNGVCDAGETNASCPTDCP